MPAIPFTDDGLVEVTRSHVVDEPVDAVWRRIVETMPGVSPADRALALGGGVLTHAPGPNRIGFHVGHDVRALAMQGGWWYRGVTSVSAVPEGSRVTYTVVNVAPGWSRWLAHWFHAPAHRRRARGVTMPLR